MIDLIETKKAVGEVHDLALRMRLMLSDFEAMEKSTLGAVTVQTASHAIDLDAILKLTRKQLNVTDNRIETYELAMVDERNEALKTEAEYQGYQFNDEWEIAGNKTFDENLEVVTL